MLDWQTVKTNLRGQMTADVWEMYVYRLRLVEEKPGVLVIACPNEYVRAWMQVRLRRIVERTLDWLCDEPVTIEYVIEAKRSQEPSASPVVDAKRQRVRPGSWQ